MKETIKRYVYSSFITFIATFVAVVVPQYLGGEVSWESGAWVGVTLAAVRLGVKAVWENLSPIVPKLLDYAKRLLSFKKKK